MSVDAYLNLIVETNLTSNMFEGSNVPQKFTFAFENTNCYAMIEFRVRTYKKTNVTHWATIMRMPFLTAFPTVSPTTAPIFKPSNSPS